MYMETKKNHHANWHSLKFISNGENNYPVLPITYYFLSKNYSILYFRTKLKRKEISIEYDHFKYAPRLLGT